MMLGAIVGDIVGSRFEWHNIKSKDFKLFNCDDFATDDSIMTLAIADALMQYKSGNYNKLRRDTINSMLMVGRPYSDCGYGLGFYEWLYGDEQKPYNSCGNGSAMRVSAVAYVAKSLEEVKQMSLAVTDISHNHPEGIKGAEATAVATYMALNGSNKEEIKKYIYDNYYKFGKTLAEIRPKYKFEGTCQQTVPQALAAFWESTDFEDAIRNAISIGGDSDTVAAITGAVAGAYYGVPTEIAVTAGLYLDAPLKQILNAFESKYLKR